MRRVVSLPPRTRRRRCSLVVAHGMALLGLLLSAAAVVENAAAAAAAAAVHCVTDWSGGTASYIPESSINDGYCDCLDTAADETETNACAGVSQWAGNTAAAAAAAAAASQTTTTPVTFQCPQQPELQIPVSRVNDGVCDCCDGADEKHSGFLCDDECAAILAERAQRLEALRQRYDVGSQKRTAALQEFVNFVTESKRQIQQTLREKQTQQQALEMATAQFNAAKAEYMQKRIDRFKDMALHTAIETILDYKVLSVQELEWWIVHTCQSAGESAEENSSSKTCVPLRLAGLDVGAAWESGTYRFRQHSQNDDDKSVTAEIANLLYHNSCQQQDDDDNSENIVWNASALKQKSKNKNRRRLMRVVAAEEEDYDDYPDYDDYMGDEYDDDRYYEEDRGRPKRTSRHEEKNNNNDDDDGPRDETKRDELVRLIQQQNFSKSRVALLNRATTVIELIDKATKEKEESGEKEEEESGKKEGEDPAKAEKSFVVDPMVVPMVKSKLEKKTRMIQRGFDYAVSAKVLLRAVEEAFGSSINGDDDLLRKEMLFRLAVGTLNHGKLSAIQLYRILVTVIPELQEEQQQQDSSQTCAASSSSHAAVCPPRSIERQGVKVPSASILNTVESFCASELGKNQPDDGACVAESNGDLVAQGEIPSDIPDGYYGYYDIHPRAEDDFFSEIFRDFSFAAIGDEEVARAKVVEMEKKVEKLDEDVANLENKLKELEESIGGDNPDKFGPNGELHSLRDECFSVEAGKYEYEVCMFGSASQKDKGSKGGGTNLGRWKEATIETVTGDRANGHQEYQQRVWKWENGTKCWNGPKRSATVYVTCGAENKVLSADEPDTCRYELEMESPIACDDDFRVRHGL